MNINEKMKNTSLKSMMLLVTYCALLILGLVYFKNIIAIIGNIISLLQPFIIGFLLAFIFNIPMKLYNKKLPIQNEKKRKTVSGILSILSIFMVLSLIVMVVVPQVVENVKLLIENMPDALKQTQAWANQLIDAHLLPNDLLSQLEEFEINFTNTLLKEITTLVPSIASRVTHLTSSLINIFMGFVVSIYMLFTKDTLIRQVKKVGKAFLNEKQYKQVETVISLTATTFENFLAGQLTEACIIGSLCYIGCLLLGIPYASIAGVVIGMTNIIPYFGPFIGAFISCLLIVFVSPIKALVFLIFSTVLQQVESNLIYPHVVGSSVGLSALWVLFAVSVGGGLFGIVGMVFGLPTFSVIYELMRRLVNRRIKAKE